MHVNLAVNQVPPCLLCQLTPEGKYLCVNGCSATLDLLWSTGMSDFQYLAVHSSSDGKQMSMYDKVLMLKPEKEEFFMSDLPLYIPPPIFSRLDTPVDYYYRPETQHRLVPFC